MSDIYNKYFAKDKPLRHYSQHLFVAFLGFFSLDLFDVETNVQNLLIFLLASFIVDLDGLISIFIFRKKIKGAGKIIKSLRSFNFVESATLATTHHKKLDKLVIHNIFGLLFTFSVILWSIKNNESTFLIFGWAIIFHFVFDILDDLYQLRHLNNWLWPIYYLKKPLQRS